MHNQYFQFGGANKVYYGSWQVIYIGVDLFFIGPDFVSVNKMLDLLQFDLS